ncbi:MAG: amidohydrolase [Bacteroidota bacterium]
MMSSCSTPSNVDTIFYNGIIYTVSDSFDVVEAMAVKDGKVVSTGTLESLQTIYVASKKVDLQGSFVYPGFYDAHCHFLGYGLGLQEADLVGATSFEEVIQRLNQHQEKHSPTWLIGRGWDQNDWPEKAFPTNELLDQAFPDVPVYLTRIDGHAAVANSKALEIAGITSETQIQGGEIKTGTDGQPTGVLVDNAMQLVEKSIPVKNTDSKRQALIDAQQNCFNVGLTSVADAGLSAEEVKLIQSMHEDGTLLMRINAWLNPSEENIETFVKKGVLQTEKLTVSAIKLYADGALGSRGALMLEPYTDDPNNTGLMMQPVDYYHKWARIAYENGYQLATHCIGDSANRLILKVYGEFLQEKNDRRWRIEHAQVVHPDDVSLFSKYSVVPSVQPTHATSDMYWADERLGADRLKTGYIYQELLQQNGWLPNGSDFPVESINPLPGFYAAVTRQDVEGYPEGGFQPENALTREQALRAMTIWAAKAGFEEHLKGSLEPGKVADFVILDEDIMKVDIQTIPKIKVRETYIDGVSVASNQ